MRRRHVRRGAALLEVVVALAVLATAGVAAVTLAIECARSVARAREADARMRRANAFLTAVSLWPREDLDRRLGDRAQGPWRLAVSRPTATLYVITLADTVPGGDAGATLLATALYRPEPHRAEP